MLNHADQSLLSVVDIQSRLAAAMDAKELAAVLRTTRILLTASARLAIPVIATQQYPQGLGPLHDDVRAALPKGATVIDKTAFSCCGAAGYLDAIQSDGRGQVVITGMEAHVCVLQTAAELSAHGLEVFVVEDGVCSRSRADRDNALARLRDHGVSVTNVESVLFEWLKDASHEHFKELSRLIR